MKSYTLSPFSTDRGIIKNEIRQSITKKEPISENRISISGKDCNVTPRSQVNSPLITTSGTRVSFLLLI